MDTLTVAACPPPPAVPADMMGERSTCIREGGEKDGVGPERLGGQDCVLGEGWTGQCLGERMSSASAPSSEPWKGKEGGKDCAPVDGVVIKRGAGGGF